MYKLVYDAFVCFEQMRSSQALWDVLDMAADIFPFELWPLFSTLMVFSFAGLHLLPEG